MQAHPDESQEEPDATEGRLDVEEHPGTGRVLTR